jgi:uncharacterized surface protein with fasciclin (FAS1) repeats
MAYKMKKKSRRFRAPTTSSSSIYIYEEHLDEDWKDVFINQSFIILKDILDNTGLLGNVISQSDITLITPTDKAFEAIENILINMTYEELIPIIKNHVILGKISIYDFDKGIEYNSLGDYTYNVTVQNSRALLITHKPDEDVDTYVISGIIECYDGTLFVTDKVVL